MLRRTRILQVVIALPLSFATAAFSQQQNTSSATKLKSVLDRAQQGDTQAQIELGMDYQFGLNVAKNASQAIRWYETAATRGNPEARLELGKIYLDGDLVS